MRPASGRPATLLEPLLAMQSGSSAFDSRTVSNEESKGSDQNFHDGIKSNAVRNDLHGRSIDDIVDSLGKYLFLYLILIFNIIA